MIKTSQWSMIFVAVILTACSVDSKDKGLVNAAGQQPDTARMITIGDNLFEDKNGDLFFHVSDYSSGDGETPRSRYIDHFGIVDPLWDKGPPLQLKDRIDPKSWYNFHDTIYADDNTVYCHSLLSSGGSLGPKEQLDPGSLRIIVTHESGSWREVVTKKDLRLAGEERAWHYTDGVHVIDYRCDDQGKYESWSPEY